VIQRLLPFATLVALFIGLAVASPHFLTGPNLSTVIRQTTVINIMALGMTLIIISGGIDLSVGSILAFGGFMGTLALQKGYSIPVAIAVGIAAGTLCGLLNGVAITRLKVNPFIVTLGTMGIFRGVTLLISNGLPVHEIPLKFAFLGVGDGHVRDSDRAVDFADVRGGDAYRVGAYAAGTLRIFDRQQS
jgi:ribose transport system permease protein